MFICICVCCEMQAISERSISATLPPRELLFLHLLRSKVETAMQSHKLNTKSVSRTSFASRI